MIPAVIGIFILFMALYVLPSIWQTRHLPPGPFPLPLVGNLLSIDLKRPHADFANMADKYGKLFRIHMGRRRMIVINSYEIAKEALVTKATDFAGRPRHFFGDVFGRNRTDFAFQSLNNRWKIQHKLAVTALRLSENKANIADHTEKLCSRLNSFDGKPFYLHDIMINSVANCLSSLIFGKEHKLNDREVEMLVYAVQVFRESLSAGNMIDTFPMLKYIPMDIFKNTKRAGEIRDEIFERKFEEHILTFQKDNIRDLIDALWKGFHEISHDGLLTKEQLVSSASDFFFPGTETPYTVITWAIFYVIKHPNVQARLHRQLDDVLGNTDRLPEISDKPNLPFLNAFITEVLRIVSETPLAVPHSTTRDTSLAGFKIPRDMTVLINLWAIHHDPDIWGDPFSFRPERFLDRQGQPHVEGVMSFSAGKRSCPGEFFGKKLVFLYLARLLSRFRFECPEGTTLPKEEESVNGLVIECKPFQVRVIPRKRS
ncbi:cytochrome P450 1A1-like [Stylophora pistillata]|uniref:cytochrome P450 1A1-like n=1 Tax=Stylophora pistillata TaxID=50429 RepID=UPI000C0528B6|nr:cytochrome P450 1A1-like [Stylophora pistillata]